MKHTNSFWKFRLNRGEMLLWSISAGGILLSFLLFDRGNPLTLLASLIGVTSLILNAKGHPLGQLLMILFSCLYGYLSYDSAYYGEMATYLGMTGPMAAFSLISWQKNPYQGDRPEVRVNRLCRQEVLVMLLLTLGVTGIFYRILLAFHTANLIPSTISVATSFLAVYLTFRRSAWFALAYAANDVVLILLWVLAAMGKPAYLSMVICFVVFLVNDLYGFRAWLRMRQVQESAA